MNTENTDTAVLGWAIGLVGAAIGVAGGLFGTYASIRATQSDRERAFVARASIVMWIAIIVFVALLAAVPNRHRHLLWIPYAIGLPVGITYWSRTQLRIRQETAQPTPLRPQRLPPRAERPQHRPA